MKTRMSASAWAGPSTSTLVLPKQVDEFTIVDEYHALPKSEEMLELEEMLESIGVWFDSSDDDESLGGIHFI